MKDLSILIPSRNEMFLKNTVDDIIKHAESDYEIIVGLDGQWADPPLNDHPRLIIIHHSVSIGQRAITNECAKISKGRYLMKVDAHCAFDQGFDVKMLKEMKPDWTMVPTMRNLHAFDWVCPDGHRRYQGPSGPCTTCGKPTSRDVVWIPKENPQSNSYRFDTDMHFQYWKEYEKAHPGDLTESMSLQGSCFMCSREKYFELDLCSEEFSSWGQQGVEVACKTWLSGGRVIVNHKTWYAHMFRTQGGDFSFPYDNPGRAVVDNRRKSKELFAKDKWPKAIHSFKWLLEKFKPPEWGLDLTKGVVYYTDNKLDPKILQLCQDNLKNAFKGRIVSVSLQPIKFGENYVLPLERGLLTMAKQILKGLETIDTDIVFFCEHDVLYHKSHFDFTPPKKDVYYYNTNVWQVRAEDGHALFYDHRSLSGLCAYRETLIKHYRERIRRIEELLKEAGKNNGAVHSLANPENTIPLREGIHRLGFEPGTHNRADRIDFLPADNYQSEQPNVDIKHKNNWTQNRWRLDQFRTKPKVWKETDEVPFWGRIKICP